MHHYAAYAHVRVAEGHRLRGVVRHVLGLYAGFAGVRSWRRFLLERCNEPAANADLLLDALRIVRTAA
jgi:tRNA-dihydrouridine synthase A